MAVIAPKKPTPVNYRPRPLLAIVRSVTAHGTDLTANRLNAEPNADSG